MANEVQYQKVLIDAIRAGGGFAFKMSHKFMVGIPDLFIKPHSMPPSMWEVKLRMRPKTNKPFSLPLTALQKVFLRDYSRAGGICGVISLLKGPTELYMLVARYEVAAYGDNLGIKPWQISRTAHQVVPRTDRNKHIFEIFMRSAYETYQP